MCTKEGTATHQGNLVPITVRPYPGSVTPDQMYVGMVIEHRLHDQFHDQHRGVPMVVMSLPDPETGYFRTLTLEQAARFTREEVDNGKLDGLGNNEDAGHLGIMPYYGLTRWSHFSYCVDSTPYEGVFHVLNEG